MDYRLATFEDWTAITEYVNRLDYFMPVNPVQLGGNWLIAIDTNSAVRGTIWFFAAAPNLYVDYWAATSARIAAKLASLLQALCQSTGIKYVRGMIGSDNLGARNLATGLGMFESAENYKLVFRSL